MIKQYEYKIETGVSEKHLVDEMNLLGEQGWQVFQATQENKILGRNEYTLFCRRRVIGL